MTKRGRPAGKVLRYVIFHALTAGELTRDSVVDMYGLRSVDVANAIKYLSKKGYIVKAGLITESDSHRGGRPLTTYRLVPEREREAWILYNSADPIDLEQLDEHGQLGGIVSGLRALGHAVERSDPAQSDRKQAVDAAALLVGSHRFMRKLPTQREVVSGRPARMASLLRRSGTTVRAGLLSIVTAAELWLDNLKRRLQESVIADPRDDFDVEPFSITDRTADFALMCGATKDDVRAAARLAFRDEVAEHPEDVNELEDRLLEVFGAVQDMSAPQK